MSHFLSAPKKYTERCIAVCIALRREVSQTEHDHFQIIYMNQNYKYE